MSSFKVTYSLLNWSLTLSHSFIRNNPLHLITLSKEVLKKHYFAAYSLFWHAVLIHIAIIHKITIHVIFSYSYMNGYD